MLEVGKLVGVSVCLVLWGLDKAVMVGFVCGFPKFSVRRQDFVCSASSPGAGKKDVVIVGAGISGLVAARRIRETRPDLDVLVLEASDEVGGRIRSDHVDGYIFDRGFQVFIEAYPAQRRVYDTEREELKR